MQPSSRPQIDSKKLLDWIKKDHPGFKLPDLFVAGIRGYYLDSLGATGKNDRNMYDDAIFIVVKGKVIPFNGNTDPAAFRSGIANLKPGVWPAYKLDFHKGQYMALCQRIKPVTVHRDGKGDDTGMFGINIHKGGYKTTSSEGCQTLPPEQWADFINTFILHAQQLHGKAYRSTAYTYVLLENTAATNNTAPANMPAASEATVE